jgi:hypothetical protein
MMRPWAMRLLELSAAKDDLELPVEFGGGREFEVGAADPEDAVEEDPAEGPLALEGSLTNGFEELPPVPAGRFK